MKVSEAGLRLIAGFEGCRLQRYNDPAPGRHCTVGIGHLLHEGPCDGRPGEFDLPDMEAALRLFSDDLVRHEDAVEKVIERRMGQHQFNALVSLCFNIGTGAFASSTVARLFNQGDIAGAARAFGMWVKAGGQTLPGLVRRRKEEAEHFLTPDGDEPAPTPRDWWADFLPVLVAS